MVWYIQKFQYILHRTTKTRNRTHASRFSKWGWYFDFLVYNIHHLYKQYELSTCTKIPYVHDIHPVATYDSKSTAAYFHNFYRFDLYIYFDNGSEFGLFSGIVEANGGTESTNTYHSHKFFLRKNDQSLVETLVIKASKVMYIFGPEDGDIEMINSSRYKLAFEKSEFINEYYNLHGVHWIGTYPPQPPILPRWPTDFVGQDIK